MPSFLYKAVTSTGQVVSETIDAANEQSVTRELFQRGYRPISIKMTKSGAKESEGGFGSDLFAKKIKPDELVLFTRELVTLLRAGVPMLTALEALGSQSQNVMGETINKIYVDVMSGNSLSQAMDKHPKIFNKLFVNSVKAGEMSGALDEVLERMALMLKKDAESRKKVKSAMKYPILVMSAMVIAFIVMMTAVIPKFAAMFSKMKVELPLPTRILMGTSNFVQQYIVFILGFAALVFIGSQVALKTKQGRYWWDDTKMKIPLIGPLIAKSAMSRFSKMFETLNKSGLPILQTLQTVSSAVGNVVIENIIRQVALGVEKGEGISGAMKKHKIFPAIVVRMVAIGEQSGSLDEMLGSISDHYDVEVEHQINGLTSMIEPILTVVLGVAVVIMAVGIFLPMWNMAGGIK